MLSKILITAALAAASFSTFALGRAEVRVINDSDYTVWEIYTSPSYSSSYGRRDLLGGTIIRSGYSRVINFDVPDADDQCEQDVIAKTQDGRKWQKRLNVCEASTWRLVN